MNTRRKNSKGQALVLVTVGLVAMAGLMGLAVDMGWSFFVQKQEQAVADGAALAAVQEAFAEISGGVVTGITCSSSGVTCLAASTQCGAGGVTANLAIGCLYATKNFAPPVPGQSVWIQSGTGTPPTVPDVKGVVYWVTVRAYQSVPQLFSSILGNTKGQVAAIATAAIAPSVGPGSFFGMDESGDPGAAGLVGIDLQGRLKSNSSSKSICGGDVCAPMGFIFSSQCAGNSTAADGGACSSSTNDAADGGKTLGYGSPVVVAGAGVATNFNTTPSTSLPASSSTFNDFFAPNPQPPLVASQPITSCGYLNGSIPSSATGAFGPYQYYAYTKVSSVNTPSGLPVTFPTGVQFSSSATTGCPGAGQAGVIATGGTSQSSTAFATFIFWGGMQAPDGAYFGSGQYVMAGTSSSTGVVFDVAQNGTISGDSAIGTMFIFTDGMYPGLWTSSPTAAAGTGQVATVPNGTTYLAGLYQGTLGPFKNATTDLYGVVYQAPGSTAGMPPSMDVYTGVVWWQDRRNSTVGYDQPMTTTCAISECTGDNGSVIYCYNNSCPAGTPPASFLSATNHVTATSPGLNLDPGKGRIGLYGAYYQPRGAWMSITAGNSGFDCGGTVSGCALQIVTGMLDLDTGTVNVNLQGPTNPILTYKARLIQ